jgi:2'-hydroxyisoflavone reductase
MNKRDFIKTTAAASLLTFINPLEVLGATSKSINNKKALVLGGRGFIGPTIVNSLLDAGYEVTLLNRGKTNTHLFKELPVIVCDRELENKEGLKSISKKHKNTYWDVVIDTWQKSPKAVADFLDEFKSQIGHFHYISTISVYDEWDKKFITEAEPLNPLPSFPKSIAEEHRYAIRKTFSEEAIRARISNYTIHRSHGMKNYRVTRPKDPNAQPFWPIRFYRGGEILLPKAKNHYMQVTDVVSLVNFIIHCTVTKTYGEFNVAYHLTPFKDYVSSLIHATKKPKNLHWIDGEFLKENGLIPYKIIPLWRERPVGTYHFNVQKAINAGLVNRPMVDMITDQIEGYKCRFPNDDVKFGEMVSDKQIKYYSTEKEKEIIEKWTKK